jgi:hypothetical protein
VFDASSGHPRLHQTRRAFGQNHFLMWRDVIAMGVRNEGETFWVPGIEPEIVRREVDAALVPNFDHERI